MNEEIKIPTMKVTPLKKICMTIGELPTSYLETMTYYEMLVWFTNFLRDSVIPAVNNNAEAVHELQQLFIELQNYVNNYFDNLDVQEEINNKLDDMVEAGTLQEIIASYLNSKAMFGFDNVNSMKEATNLIDGSYAKTLGYYEKNDGGSGLYKIREITNDDIVDNGTIIPLDDNNLIAELILIDSISPEQMGAKCNNIDDDSEYLLNAFNIAVEKNLKLILNKNYYINSEITLNGDNNDFIKIECDSGSLTIDGEITIEYINNSKISLNLLNGGNNNIDEYGVIFKNLYRCDLNLQAINVKKTAFYIKTQGTNPYTACKFCTVTLKGHENTRTLLHASPTLDLGVAFGTYIDIEDTAFDYPIRFQNVTDVNILHYENYINDTTFTKNSLELYRASVRCSILALGGKCKNLIYMENSDLRADYILLINEDTEMVTSDTLRVTGIYVKGSSQLYVDDVENTRCLYSVNCEEMTNQSLLYVNHTTINQSTPLGRGMYIPDIFRDTLTLSYNANLRAISITPTSLNEHVNVSNVKVEKLQDMIFIRGYITIDADIAYNTEIFELRDNDIAAYVSNGFMRQSANIIKISQINSGAKIVKALNPLTLTDGANIYIDMCFRSSRM